MREAATRLHRTAPRNTHHLTPQARFGDGHQNCGRRSPGCGVAPCVSGLCLGMGRDRLVLSADDIILTHEVVRGRRSSWEVLGRDPRLGVVGLWSAQVGVLALSIRLCSGVVRGNRPPSCVRGQYVFVRGNNIGHLARCESQAPASTAFNQGSTNRSTRAPRGIFRPRPAQC